MGKNTRDPAKTCTECGSWRCGSLDADRQITDLTKCYWHQPARVAAKETKDTPTVEQVEEAVKDGTLTRQEAKEILSELARGVSRMKTTAAGDLYEEVDHDLRLRAVDKLSKLEGWEEKPQPQGPQNLIIVSMPRPDGASGP